MELDEYAPQRRLGPDEYRPVWQRPTAPEHRWPVFLAVAVVIAGQTWIAGALAVRPIWIYPLIAGVLYFSFGPNIPFLTGGVLVFVALAFSFWALPTAANHLDSPSASDGGER